MRCTAVAALLLLTTADVVVEDTCNSKQCASHEPSSQDSVLLQAKVASHGFEQKKHAKQEGSAKSQMRAKKQRRAKKERHILAMLARRRARYARVKAMKEKPFTHKMSARVAALELTPPRRTRFGNNSFFKRPSLWKKVTKARKASDKKMSTKARKFLTTERKRSLEWQAHVEVPERLRSLRADVGKLTLAQQKKVNQKLQDAGRLLARVVDRMAGHDMPDPQMQWIYNQIEELWWVVGELEHVLYHGGHDEGDHHYDDHDGADGVHGEIYCETGDRAHDPDLCLDTGDHGCCHWNGEYDHCFSSIGRSICHSAHDPENYEDYDDIHDYYWDDEDYMEMICEDIPIPPNPHVETCQQGLEMGLCHEMPEEASHFCPVTCGYCALQPQSENWECVDRPLPPNPYVENCWEALEMGICADYPHEAAMYCPATCGSEGCGGGDHHYDGGDHHHHDDHHYDGWYEGGDYPMEDAGGYAPAYDAPMYDGDMYGGEYPMADGDMYGDMYGGDMYGGDMYGGDMYGGDMYGGTAAPPSGGDMYGATAPAPVPTPRDH